MTTEADSWWARRLAPQAPQRPVYAPQPLPQQPQAPQYRPPTQQPYGAPQVPDFGSLQEMLAWAEANNYGGNGGDAARAGEKFTCPSCNSANFFSHSGGSMNPNSMARCFDCGYNGRFMQNPDAPQPRS